MRRIVMSVLAFGVVASCGGDDAAEPTSTEAQPEVASTTTTEALTTTTRLASGFAVDLRSVYFSGQGPAADLVTDCFELDLALTTLDLDGPAAAIQQLLDDVDAVPQAVLDVVVEDPAVGLPALQEACEDVTG